MTAQKSIRDFFVFVFVVVVVIVVVSFFSLSLSFNLIITKGMSKVNTGHGFETQLIHCLFPAHLKQGQMQVQNSEKLP